MEINNAKDQKNLNNIIELLKSDKENLDASESNVAFVSNEIKLH
ncbi:26101_t:CDS:2, partial [Gigaspora rosea]